MKADETDFPDPRFLEHEADEMPPKPPLRDYYQAMMTLKKKGYSYQEIADWITEKIGITIKRGQVSYLLTAPMSVLADEDLQERIDNSVD